VTLVARVGLERLPALSVIVMQATWIVLPPALTPALTLLRLGAARQTRNRPEGLWHREALMGEVVAMPVRSNPGVFFEPEVIGLMSEAFEAACKALRDAGEPQIVREAIAGRIIAAAGIGERDPVRLRAAALAGAGPHVVRVRSGWARADRM